MNNPNSEGLFEQLTGPQGDAVTVVPGTGNTIVSYEIRKLKAKRGDQELKYVSAIIALVELTVTQPASGATPITAQQMYSAISGIKLYSPTLGNIYSHSDLNGAQHGLISQVFAGGFRFPSPNSFGLSASSGGSVLQIPLVIPFVSKQLADGRDLAQPAKILENGIFEVGIAPSNSLAPFSTGAVVTSVTVKAYASMVPGTEINVPPVQVWRVRTTPGGQSQHKIPGIGDASGLKNVEQGCGLINLLWASNANGLGGAATVGAITAVENPSNGQENITVPEAFFMDFFDKGADLNATELSYANSVASSWPYTSGFGNNQANGGSNVRNNFLFFPVHVSGLGMKLDRVPQWLGDYTVKFQYAAVPAAQGVWLCNEIYTPGDEGEKAAHRALNIPAGAPRTRKVQAGHTPSRFHAVTIGKRKSRA